MADGRSGAGAILQRFGAALNLNVYIDVVVLDGVYAEDDRGGLDFWPLPPPDEEEMQQVLETVARRIQGLLTTRGLLADDWRGGCHARHGALRSPCRRGDPRA